MQKAKIQTNVSKLGINETGKLPQFCQTYHSNKYLHGT